MNPQYAKLLNDIAAFLAELERDKRASGAVIPANKPRLSVLNGGLHS